MAYSFRRLGNGEDGKDALVYNTIVNTTTAPMSNYSFDLNSFNRTPNVDDTFTVIWENSTTSVAYICIYRVLSVGTTTVPSTSVSYYQISGTDGTDGKDALVYIGSPISFNYTESSSILEFTIDKSDSDFNRTPENNEKLWITFKSTVTNKEYIALAYISIIGNIIIRINVPTSTSLAIQISGTNGTNGVGVPAGGTAGQVLSKIDGTDYNTEWVTPSGGGGSSLPTGGTTGQVLAKASNADGDVEWITPSSGGSEVHNFSEDVCTYKCWASYNNEFATRPIYFLCDLDSDVTVEYTIKGNITSATQAPSPEIGLYKTLDDVTQFTGVNTYINNVAITTYTDPASEFPIAVGRFEYKIKGTFTPNKADNAVFVIGWVCSEFTIDEVNVRISGKNICILNSERPIHIECFNNNLYIAVQEKNRLKYKIDTMSNVSSNLLDTLKIGELLLSYVNNMNTVTFTNDDYVGSDYVAYPATEKVTKNTVPLAIDNSAEGGVEFGLCATSVNGANLCGTRAMRLSSGVLTAGTDYVTNIYRSTAIAWLPTGIGYGSRIFLQANAEEGKLALYGYNNSKSGVKYNTENITGIYQVAVVKENALMVGDTPTFRGFVAMTQDLTQYFYPERESTYRVQIGKGKNATAYYQSDGTINIYLNVNNSIYKYVLAINQSTNQYEISGNPVFLTRAKQVQELYDGYYLIYNGNEYQIKTLGGNE